THCASPPRPGQGPRRGCPVAEALPLQGDDGRRTSRGYCSWRHFVVTTTFSDSSRATGELTSFMPGARDLTRFRTHSSSGPVTRGSEWQQKPPTLSAASP